MSVQKRMVALNSVHSLCGDETSRVKEDEEKNRSQEKMPEA
jgi:hypothetical protein